MLSEYRFEGFPHRHNANQSEESSSNSNSSSSSNESIGFDDSTASMHRDGDAIWTEEVEQSFRVRLIDDYLLFHHIRSIGLRKHWPFIHHVDEEKSSCQTMERCSGGMN